MKKFCEKISNTISRMSPFQKIQVLSALVPYYSSVFVVLTTYIVCWKKKISFFGFGVCFFTYGILLSLTLHFISDPIIKYIVACVISLVGNYCMVCIQMKGRKASNLFK